MEPSDITFFGYEVFKNIEPKPLRFFLTIFIGGIWAAIFSPLLLLEIIIDMYQSV